VGETARADRFSLNGYAKETNPLLKQEQLINFNNFWSCGTSTAKSVPCMFSTYKASEYSKAKSQSTENVLDVLKHAGVNVLWLDNNSDSKGVADRVEYQSFKNSEVNPLCNPECRDVGMLEGIQAYINQHPKGDIIIVLHQMGNHGPAYYKRYPAEFEKFTPVCKTNQLEECSKEELDNAYDNAILYTDYFLSKVIAILKQNSDGFETAMFYISDHGESLGEKGLYLHGLPNFIAPDTQRHVPAILWVGDNYAEINTELLKNKQNEKLSHDNVFHSLLGFMEIESSVYDKTMDIFYMPLMIGSKDKK
jgi:lipid A ethanolaminephosphotransferase